MYREFYNLHLKPFQISTDQRFLWLGERHKEALAVLQYGILDNKGFLLLTGDVGTGKTTLLNALTHSLGDDVFVALITDPGLAKMDFFKFVADSFEMDRNFKTKGDFLLNLRSYLLDIHRQNKQTLLIIDECQRLNQKLLEEVRLLSNIEKYDSKLINIFFVGQSEFNKIILRPRNRAIRQRITINYDLTALTEKDTDQYIRHRLRVAGADAPLFTSRAINAVFKFSNGYPRLINIICDHALLTGFVREKKKIDHKIVTECAEELKISDGLPVKQSLATPEAIEKNPVEQLSDEMLRASAPWKISRPLAIALIVVVILWFGLVAMFFFYPHPTTTTISVANDPQLSDSRSVQDTQKSIQEHVDASANGIKVGEVAVVVSNDAVKRMPVDNKSLASDSTAFPTSLQSVATGTPVTEVEEEKEARSVLTTVEETGVAPTEKRISLNEIKAAFGAYPQIPFGFNSNTLESDSTDMLALIARYCLQNPDAAIGLWGYTDQSGNRGYNIKLSEFRADVVKYYLVGFGLKADAITTRAIGPDAEGPGGTTVPYDGARRKVVIEIIAPNK